MPVDSFRDIVGRVQLRAPQAGRFLCEDWVRNAFRRVERRRLWSWRRKFDQFLFPALYNTGTVTVTRNSTIVTGSGTTWTDAMAGRQFRIGNNTPIYTIENVDSATQLTLNRVYAGSTDSAVNYEIYLAYVTVPDDFQAFVSVWDPNFNWQLLLDYSQEQLNAVDAQRSNRGDPHVVAFESYSTSQVGTVSAPVQVDGSGPDPGAGGTFTGPSNAVFTVEITTGGASGTAVFQWKKDGGSYTTGVTTDASGNAQSLADGVEVHFPTGQTYILDDVWVIQAFAGPNPGSPRMEIWPHQTAEYVLPYLYIRTLPDISDPTAVVPRTLSGDILLELALAEAASWPGPSADRPNPYYRLELADRHRQSADRLIQEAELLDEEISLQDVLYQEATSLPFATLPAWGSSDWLQSHAIF